MQPTTNNLLTEISALVIASLLIIAGGVLLFFNKIDFTAAALLFASALGIFGFKSAISAPSAAQQATLQGLVASQQGVVATQQQLVGQVLNMQTAPTPVVAPQVVQMPFNPAMSGTSSPNFTTSYNPPSNVRTGTAGGGMPSAMLTTQTYPAMPTGQPQ